MPKGTNAIDDIGPLIVLWHQTGRANNLVRPPPVICNSQLLWRFVRDDDGVVAAAKLLVLIRASHMIPREVANTSPTKSQYIYQCKQIKSIPGGFCGDELVVLSQHPSGGQGPLPYMNLFASAEDQQGSTRTKQARGTNNHGGIHVVLHNIGCITSKNAKRGID